MNPAAEMPLNPNQFAFDTLLPQSIGTIKSDDTVRFTWKGKTNSPYQFSIQSKPFNDGTNLKWKVTVTVTHNNTTKMGELVLSNPGLRGAIGSFTQNQIEQNHEYLNVAALFPEAENDFPQDEPIFEIHPTKPNSTVEKTLDVMSRHVQSKIFHLKK